MPLTKEEIKKYIDDGGQDYIYCEDCEMFVDYWKYDNIQDAGHEGHNWRCVFPEELEECIAECLKPYPICGNCGSIVDWEMSVNLPVCSTCGTGFDKCPVVYYNCFGTCDATAMEPHK